MNELVSVIVPVYKVEKYLNKCIDSIVNQTYKNLEIILVDDGSPDNCPKICDEWAKKDERIKVIHKKNGGVSAARNDALDIAKGDYIGFVDGDDYLDSEMYEILLKKALEYNADMVRCAYVIDEPGGMVKAEVDERTVLVDDKSKMLNDLYHSGHKTNFLCNKFFKREILKGLKFNENFSVGEDTLFVYEACEKADKIVYYDVPLYYYTVRGDQANAKGDFNYQAFRTFDYMTDKDCAIMMYFKFFVFSCMAIHDSVLNGDDKFDVVRNKVILKKDKIKKAIKLKGDKTNCLKFILITKFPEIYKFLLKKRSKNGL